MKFAIIGAGAIGGYVGVKLALAGEDVVFIARGANLQAIQRHGMTLRLHDGHEQVARQVRATDDYAQAGVQDVVVLAMKAHQVEAVAGKLHALLGPHTAIVTMQNGIPFWYFHGQGGPHEGQVVRSVDPEGTLAQRIPVQQVIGSVVYPAAELVAPGVVRHIEGDRFPLGELDGSRSERVLRLSECFAGAGLKAPVLDDIRAEIWLKLWGNLSFNPISALAHATLVDICQYPPTRELAAAMMREAQAVAHQLGSGCRWTSASPAPRRWASTRPACCRTSRPVARPRSTRWSARWSNSAGSPARRHRTSTASLRSSSCWRGRWTNRPAGCGCKPCRLPDADAR
jgi:2-dehydropantoate 2-reductase